MRTRTGLELRDPNPHMGPLISAYQDGILSNDEIRVVEQHLLECDICRAFYDALQQTRELIGNLPDPAFNPDEREQRDYYAVMSATIYPANRKRARKNLKKERKNERKKN